MLDLNKKVFENGGFDCNLIVSDSGYLLFQEASEEYGIDYTVLDENLDEVDGGQLCWGDYNEESEMYDIENDKDGLTYKEFFDEINKINSKVQFNKNSILIKNEDVIYFIKDYI